MKIMSWAITHGLVLGGIIMELTQEQLDAIVAERLAEVKKGLFTEEELNKRVTSEVDRRVETGIQKGLETQRSKWEKEYSQKAQMSAEELAQKELESRMGELTTREKDIQKKQNRLDALELMASANIPKANYEKMLGVLISDDAEATKANVESFIDVFNTTKKDVETQIKSELGHVKNPKQGNADVPVDKSSFDKMGYAEKMAFKKDNPDKFTEFMK